MYGAHDTRPFYASFDRLQLEDVRVNGEVVATVWPRNISYPQFYRIGNRLEMWFRADPQSEVHRVAYNEVIQAFPLQSELLLTPGTAERVYMNKLAVAGRTLALSWMYRLFSTDDNVRNEGMFVVVSHDGGETWFELAGRPVSLPLTRGDVLPVISLPAESNPLNQTTSAFGPDGRFYMTYYAKDMRGIPQLFLAGFGPDGTLQHDLPMTRNTTPFELFGRGTLVLPLSRPQIVVSEKYAHVIYRAGEQMQVSSLDLALGQRLDSVTRVYSQPLGAWEPAVDDDSWREDGSLWVYLQDARQGPLDAAAPGPTGSASLLVFTED
jgi:hypothetical protein